MDSQWLHWGLANSQILGTRNLPTVIELQHDGHTGFLQRVQWKARDLWEAFGQGRAGYGVWRLECLKHIDARLPGPVPSAKDVFLVCRPQVSNRNIRVDTPSKHWSVYSQGHFYHLSAPTKPRRLWNMSHQVSANTHVCTQLKHQDFSSRETEDHHRFQNSAFKSIPLLAYKVGQTQHLPNEILSLAEWIIQRMSKYDLYSANCQLFALRLLVRIVMRLSDRSSFMGTALQICEWDLGNKSPHAFNDTIATGLCIHTPRPSKNLDTDRS